MLASLPLGLIILIFIFAAITVWIAGVQLSNTTDIIDSRIGLSEAMGGMIFLAITTNLPEIAIVISAALTQHIGIAIGNILGGIAIQVVVLVFLDGFGARKLAALTYRAATIQLVLEGVLAISVLIITIMATQLPKSLMIAHIAPSDLLILMTWLIGLWLIKRARSGLSWRKKNHAYEPPSIHHKESSRLKKFAEFSTFKIIVIFSVSTLLTLAAGVILVETSNLIAAHIGWSGILFGSTILAAVTALPEVSTGFAAIKNGDFTLAVSDIFGGNAFLPVLFLLATVLSGQSVLPQARNTDIYLASLGALLTAVYIFGLIFRSNRQFFYMGIDSIVVLILYILGIIGLFAIVST